MKHNPSLRITLNVILFLLVIMGWWFAAIPIALIGAWVFPRYAEIVIAGFLYDILFGFGTGQGRGFLGYAFVLGGAVLLAAIAYLKIVVKNNS